MANHTIGLPPTVATYLQQFIHDTPILQALREETCQHIGAAMQISKEQGAFMAFLIDLLNVRRILEIGTYTGYSSLVMAMALPSDGKLITCDVNPTTTAIAKRYWQQANVCNKVELILGPAEKTLTDLLAENITPFDLIFIDADKRNYDCYYELALKLIAPKGLIIIDNTLWGGKVVENTDDPATIAIQQLNQKIATDARVKHCLLPISDGITLLYAA